MIVRKKAEATIPKPPEDFDGTIASGVVGEGRGGRDIGSSGQECESVGEELGGSIRVQNIGRAEGKDDAIEEGLEPGAASRLSNGMTTT
jgi:hypothetical protein